VLRSSDGFFEGNPYVGRVLQTHEAGRDVKRLAIFVSPLSMKDLDDVERRAGAAYAELAEAHHFDHVLPTHDGEDSDHWDDFYFPLGDARRTLLAFAALLRGETAPGVERWSADDVPAPGPKKT
jgi:guanylate kinase